MTLQTILFDLDGTLLDSAPGLMTSTNTALARCGCPPRSLAQITAAMGNGMADLIARSLPGGAEDPRFAACFNAFQEAYQSDMFTGSAPYPGILELLEALGNSGCRLAVVSNKRDGAVKALCRQFFGERIAVAIGERPGVSRKPAPDSALTALQELGMPAQTAAYVGDSEVDIATARNAHLPCFSVDWGTRTREVLEAHGAVSISHTPEELLRALNGV